MSYDKFTCSYFDDLPSRKRMEFDYDYLKDNSPDYLYHYCNGLYRLVVVRNFDSKGNRSSYSLMALGYPPAVGSWRSLYNSPVLDNVLRCFELEILRHLDTKNFTPDGDWYVSEL